MNIFLIILLIIYSLGIIINLQSLVRQEDRKFNPSAQCIALIMQIVMLIWTILLYIKS